VKTIGVSSIVATILCKRHNALSVPDAAGGAAFAALVAADELIHNRNQLVTLGLWDFTSWMRRAFTCDGEASTAMRSRLVPVARASDRAHRASTASR
jgi:hypothetical protein